MKRFLGVGTYLLFAAALSAEPRLIIDNRTDLDVDFNRVHRLMELIRRQASPGDDTVITVHIWPRADILKISPSGTDTFFAAPADVYMPRVDYQSILQGAVLAVFSGEDLDGQERIARRIWITERSQINVRAFGDAFR